MRGGAKKSHKKAAGKGGGGRFAAVRRKRGSLDTELPASRGGFAVDRAPAGALDKVLRHIERTDADALGDGSAAARLDADLPARKAKSPVAKARKPSAGRYFGGRSPGGSGSAGGRASSGGDDGDSDGGDFASRDLLKVAPAAESKSKSQLKKERREQRREAKLAKQMRKSAGSAGGDGDDDDDDGGDDGGDNDGDGQRPKKKQKKSVDGDAGVVVTPKSDKKKNKKKSSLASVEDGDEAAEGATPKSNKKKKKKSVDGGDATPKSDKKKKKKKKTSDASDAAAADADAAPTPAGSKRKHGAVDGEESSEAPEIDPAEGEHLGLANGEDLLDATPKSDKKKKKKKKQQGKDDAPEGGANLLSPALLNDLQKELLDLADHLKPTRSEVRMREALLESVTEAIHAAYPQAEVVVFGSQATGLYIPHSDLDVAVRGVYDPRAMDIVSGQLRVRRLARALKLIRSTKVPIIKMTHAESGLSVDITFNAINTTGSITYVQNLAGHSPALAPLLLILKWLVVRSGFSEPYMGGVGSYSLTLMIQHVLNDGHDAEIESLAALFVTFLHYWGCAFDYHTYGIRMYPPRVFYKPQPGWYAYGREPVLAIEDPLDPSNDVGRPSYRAEELALIFAGIVESLMVLDRERGGRFVVGPTAILETMIPRDPAVDRRRQWIDAVFGDDGTNTPEERALMRERLGPAPVLSGS